MTNEDIETCGNIEFTAYGHIDEIRSIMKYEQYFLCFICDADKYAYCILKDNIIIGYVTALKMPSICVDYSLYIDNIAVSPLYPKKGYGSNALKQFINMFPKNIVKRLQTELDRPAYEMYKKMGFSDVEMVIMEKSIYNDIANKIKKNNYSSVEELVDTIECLKKEMRS